jgi:hypothetical protein
MLLGSGQAKNWKGVPSGAPFFFSGGRLRMAGRFGAMDHNTRSANARQDGHLPRRWPVPISQPACLRAPIDAVRRRPDAPNLLQRAAGRHARRLEQRLGRLVVHIDRHAPRAQDRFVRRFHHTTRCMLDRVIPELFLVGSQIRSAGAARPPGSSGGSTASLAAISAFVLMPGLPCNLCSAVGFLLFPPLGA